MQPAFHAIPQRKGEHADKSLHRRQKSPMAKGCQHHLGVGMPAETMRRAISLHGSASRFRERSKNPAMPHISVLPWKLDCVHLRTLATFLPGAPPAPEFQFASDQKLRQTRMRTEPGRPLAFSRDA